MNPVSKNAIALICVVALIGFGAWLYLLQLSEEFNRSDKEKTKTIEALRKDRASAIATNAKYRQGYAVMQDSVMMLTVQKGQVEIELNRKTEELKQANARYKSYRQIKDTASALQICDSIVFMYVPTYLTTDSLVQLFSDSVRGLTSGWVERQNSIIETQFDKQDSALKAQIADKMQEQKQTRKESRHRKGELLKVGVFGAAVGVLLAMIFGN